MCKSWCEAIIAVIILVFTWWNTWAYSQWVVMIAAVVLLVHSFSCKSCFSGHSGMSSMPAKKKRR